MRINQVTAAALCAIGLLASQAALSAQVQQTVAAASAQDVVEFGVYLPLRNQAQLDTLIQQLHDKTSSKYQQWLQPDDFMAQFGPKPADIAAVKNALAARGLTIVSTNAHGVRVRGTAAAVTQAFSAPLQKVSTRTHSRFQARSALQLPPELAAIELRVVGLAAVPEHHVHAHVLAKPTASAPDNRYSTTGPYWFDDLKQAYDYPAYSDSTDGSTVNVAVLMSDLMYPSDVQAMFAHENFTAATSAVTTVLVDGGGVNDGNGSIEASLDVQQVKGGAPGAKVTLISIPDLSDDSIMDGYQYIIDQNKFDIVNSSFGGCELFYSKAYNGGEDFNYILAQYHDLFEQGNAQGITFVASSGDEAGLECPNLDYFSGGPSPAFVPSVSTPAADPDVTAVGGGNLVTTLGSTAAPINRNSAYVRETAYADLEAPQDPYGVGATLTNGYWGAGGGVSTVFKKPLYQLLANTDSNRMRTLPDVGMHVGGCPESAILADCSADASSVYVPYGIGLTGDIYGYYTVIGTSVSSPEFVGALAVYEQQLGKKNHRLGNANYYLYALGALQSLTGGTRAPASLQFYHRNNPGDDGVVRNDFPSYNYNYVYGNGSPDVRKLFGMTNYSPAGTPQTKTNP